jgi:DNA-directed RNA polymerase specialized sigma24 family protein
VQQRTAEELYGGCVDCRHSQQAWIALYQTCWPVLVVYLLKSRASHELAEECAQQVLARLFTTRPVIRGSVLGYLRSMARNTLLTERRRQTGSALAVERRIDQQPTYGSSEAGDGDADGSFAPQLAAEIARLPWQSRRLLVLHFYQGLSLRQCIEARGWRCAVSTCKCRLDKAVSRLATRLRENR